MSLGLNQTSRDQIEMMEAEIIELRAALGIMLLSWDNASEKLAIFCKDMTNKEAAENYSNSMKPMFDAAIAARVLYNRERV